MIGSAVLYVGVALAAAGAVAAILPRCCLGPTRRSAWLLVCLVGAGVASLALELPATEVVVTGQHSLLDAIVPRYHFHERHEIAVAADPATVDRAIRTVSAGEIRFYRALTWLRRRGRRAPESLLDAPSSAPMLALATRTGFHRLGDDPGHEIVIGAALPVAEAAQAEARAARRDRGKRPFVVDVDGYATLAMNFRMVPDGRGGTLLSTETRVHARDTPTRARFARYWRTIHPGSALIRREWLAAIRRRAEAGLP